MTTRWWRKKKISNKAREPVKTAPQRTCVACRQVKEKRALLRIVRTPSGVVEIDARGKMDGRGAYVCPAAVCLEKGLKSTNLERTLKCPISPAERERLLKNGKELLKEMSG